MKVFISYGSAADQVTALRLQALAAVNGLTAYVPPSHTRLGAANGLDPEAHQKLVDADIVLGVLGTGLITPACRNELNRAISLPKSTIVMSDPVLAAQLQPYFGSNLVAVNPANPAQAEESIVQYLKTIKAKKNDQKALVALGTLAIGLLIFAVAAQD